MFKTKIKTPAKISVGDPMYFDKPVKNRNSLIFSKKFPQDFISSLTVAHDEELGAIKILICIAPTEKHLEAYEEEKYLATHNIKTIDLGCDTACFRIEVDGREDVVDTMADGYFGYAANFTYKREYKGSLISLLIDESVYDKKIEDSLKYLFSIGDDDNET